MPHVGDSVHNDSSGHLPGHLLTLGLQNFCAYQNGFCDGDKGVDLWVYLHHAYKCSHPYPKFPIVTDLVKDFNSKKRLNMFYPLFCLCIMWLIPQTEGLFSHM